MPRASSAGSPTQWSATLSPRPASTCRSTQLYAAFNLPPTYHFANGGVDQASTLSHRGVPVQALGLLGPERLPVPRGPLVGLGREVRVLGDLLRRLEPAVLLEEVGQR